MVLILLVDLHAHNNVYTHTLLKIIAQPVWNVCKHIWLMRCLFFNFFLKVPYLSQLAFNPKANLPISRLDQKHDTACLTPVSWLTMDIKKRSHFFVFRHSNWNRFRLKMDNVICINPWEQKPFHKTQVDTLVNSIRLKQARF